MYWLIPPPIGDISHYIPSPSPPWSFVSLYPVMAAYISKQGNVALMAYLCNLPSLPSVLALSLFLISVPKLALIFISPFGGNVQPTRDLWRFVFMHFFSGMYLFAVFLDSYLCVDWLMLCLCVCDNAHPLKD